MSRNLALPDKLFERLQHTADQHGLSVEQLITELLSTLGPNGGAPPYANGDEELLVASTAALLDGTEPPITADWNELRDTLALSEAPYKSIEEAMTALRQRPWAKDR